MNPELEAAVERLVSSAVKQGYPLKAEDPAALAVIAVVITEKDPTALEDATGSFANRREVSRGSGVTPT